MNLTVPDVVVGMGELCFASPPTRRLVTHALGSCVAVFVWNPETGYSGCLHFMRPAADPCTDEPHKFADTGLTALLETMGPQRNQGLRIVACGGATITSGRMRFRVGPKNVAALIQRTAELGLVLAAHDLGGFRPRSATLDLYTGKVTVVSGSRVLVL